MNEILRVVIDTVSYVTNAPYFWLTMGSVSMISIFVGAIIYDGILPIAVKGMISIGMYATFIILTHMIRVSDVIERQNLSVNTMTYANVIAIIIITIFWIFGVLVGVYTSSKVKSTPRLDRQKK